MNVNKKQILERMKTTASKPLKTSELMKLCKVPKTAKTPFRSLLNSLVSDGTIIKIRGNRFGLLEKMNLVTGIATAHRDGYGFVVPETKGDEDIYISPRNFSEVMHGDRVVCRVESQKRGMRNEGRIIRILERAYSTIVGVFETDQKAGGYVVPQDRRIVQDIFIPKKMKLSVKPGQVVVAEITSYPTKHRSPVGEIIEILGDPKNPKVELEIFVRKYDLIGPFPSAVLRETKSISPPTSKEWGNRTNYRDWPIVTIDGKTAKDFDDAVHVRQLNKNEYELGVHIADVSFYVKEGTALDREALKRGTSVYFPGTVIPMLPPVLSENVCSLKAKKDRLTLSVVMRIDSAGNLKESKIEESIIRSKERLTYTDVGAILEEGDKFLSDRYSDFLDQFHVMEELSKILGERRTKEGSIDFDLPEPDILLDIQGRPEGIIKRERNVAHRIIEEFMLMANRTVAEHLVQLKFPFLHRIHEQPDEDKLQDLVDFTLSFDCYSLVKRKITSKHLQELLLEMKDRPEERLISTVVLRSMKQALYSEQNKGHFALAFKDYCHFTSPIRRYPDLIVHRVVRESLKHKLMPKKAKEELKSKLESVASHCSFRERNAEEAEREVVAGLKVRFMEKKVDQAFDGYITGVTGYGFFVEIENFFIEGMIHVSSLEDDYYVFYEKDHLLKGMRKGRVYRLGDKVRVRVAGVNEERGWIDFQILKKYKHHANRN